MSWIWLFLAWIFGNVWWVLAVLVLLIAWPRIHRLVRTTQAKARFIRQQGAQLQNPQNADARFQLANIYAEGRRWRRALGYAEEAVRVARENPHYADGVPYHFLLLLGDALRNRGRYAEAVDAYGEAVSRPSTMGHAEALLGMGTAKLRLGDAEGALGSLRASLEENASSLEAYFRAAQASAALGRREETASFAESFRRTAASLPRFAKRQRRLRWRLAFFFFPLLRHLL